MYSAKGKHFYPRLVLAFGYLLLLPASVCTCQSLACPHEIRSSYDHQIWIKHVKRLWLRPLLFWGVIDLDLQGQILL